METLGLAIRYYDTQKKIECMKSKRVVYLQACLIKSSVQRRVPNPVKNLLWRFFYPS